MSECAVKENEQTIKRTSNPDGCRVEGSDRPRVVKSLLKALNFHLDSEGNTCTDTLGHDLQSVSLL